MTRDELIEKVARVIKPITANLVDKIIELSDDKESAKKLLPLGEAERAIDVIFSEIFNPTYEITDAFNNTVSASSTSKWQAMLNASPLAPEK